MNVDFPDLLSLSLCAGGGGLDLALELAIGPVRPVAWVEWDAFAVDYLATCMESGVFRPAPIWSNLATFDGRQWRGLVDCLTAGYPCQPFSVAGRRGGQQDQRHLWPHVARIVGEVQPTIVFCENVTGHLSLGLDQVHADLSALDYDVAAGLFTAEEVGAPHLRQRLFILALAHAATERLSVGQRQRRHLAEKQPPVVRSGLPLFPPGPHDDWSAMPLEFSPALESGLCQRFDGLAESRGHWLKLLGNGVCPLQAAHAFSILSATIARQQSGRIAAAA